MSIVILILIVFLLWTLFAMAVIGLFCVADADDLLPDPFSIIESGRISVGNAVLGVMILPVLLLIAVGYGLLKAFSFLDTIVIREKLDE